MVHGPTLWCKGPASPNDFMVQVPASQSSGVPRGGFGVFKPHPRNSEDIGGILDRVSKKNRRLDFLL